MRMNSDFTRTQEDPITFFRLCALESARELGLTTEFVDEHISIFVAAIGANWLATASTDVPPGIPIPFPRHPLGHIVSTAGPEQVAEALELGEYLKALYAAPNISAVLTALKAQYYQTLLQLAFAARLRRAGVQDLKLEPPASEGRLSDLTFQYDGATYRAECFRPTYKTKGETSYELARLGQECLGASRECSLVVSIAVDLHVMPSAATRHQFVSIITQAIRQVAEDTSQNPGTFPAVLLEGPIGTVSVARSLPTRTATRPILVRHHAFPQTGDDWDQFMRLGIAEAAALSGIHGTVDDGEGLSHFGVWLPPGLRRGDQNTDDPEASIERLGRKIESKLGQARSTNGEHRVLVVDAWQTRLLDEVPERGERLRRKVVESHEGVAGLLMVRREWKSDLGRYGYRIVPLLRDNEPRLPDRLVVGLKDSGR